MTPGIARAVARRRERPAAPPAVASDLDATDAIDAHVAAFAATLRGPTRTRSDLLSEIRDGLRDAAEAEVDAGVDPEHATRTAVVQFGTVSEIAPPLQAELTARQGRRTAAVLAVAFPALLLGWELVRGQGISWSGPVPPLLGLLAGAQDQVALAVAVLAVGLALALHLRAVPARAVAGACGGLGLIGGTLCAAGAVAMNLPTAGFAPAVFAAPGAIPALLVSAVLLVVVLRSSARTLRLALHRTPATAIGGSAIGTAAIGTATVDTATVATAPTTTPATARSGRPRST